MTRILITGSRDWDDRRTFGFVLAQQISRALTAGEKITLVHGACPTGADAMVERWNGYQDITIERHPALWSLYGKAAGHRRNAEMVAAGADLCLAFIRDHSPGATGCAEMAERAGIPTWRYCYTVTDPPDPITAG